MTQYSFKPVNKEFEGFKLLDAKNRFYRQPETWHFGLFKIKYRYKLEKYAKYTHTYAMQLNQSKCHWTDQKFVYFLSQIYESEIYEVTLE